MVPDRCSTDQRAVLTEARWNNPRPTREVQTAPRLEGLTGGLEKWRTETQGDRTSNHSQRKVKQVHYIPYSPTNHGSNPSSNLCTGIGGGCTGSRRDGCT